MDRFEWDRFSDEWDRWLVDVALAFALVGLLLMGLTGCGLKDYYDSVAATNKAQAENPRVYKFSCLKCDGVNIEVPLDAHKTPVVVESPGAQAAQVVKSGETLGIVGFFTSLFRGGSERVIDKSSTKETFIKDTTTTTTLSPGGP